MNKYLSDLVDLQVSAQMQSAFGYVGQTVDVLSEQVPLRDGNADLFYAIAGKPTATAVQILDANGKTVRTMIGDVDAGIQRLPWARKERQGHNVAAGTLTIQVLARCGEGVGTPPQHGLAG